MRRVFALIALCGAIMASSATTVRTSTLQRGQWLTRFSASASGTGSLTTPVVPEPASVLLLGAGLLALAAHLRREMK